MAVEPIKHDASGLSQDQRCELDALLGIVEEAEIRIRELLGPGYHRFLNAAGSDLPGSA